MVLVVMIRVRLGCVQAPQSCLRGQVHYGPWLLVVSLHTVGYTVGNVLLAITFTSAFIFRLAMVVHFSWYWDSLSLMHCITTRLVALYMLTC